MTTVPLSLKMRLKLQSTLLKGTSLNYTFGFEVCLRYTATQWIAEARFNMFHNILRRGHLSPLTLMALSKTAASSVALKFAAAVTVPSFFRTCRTKNPGLVKKILHSGMNAYFTFLAWPRSSLKLTICTSASLQNTQKTMTDSFQWRHATHAYSPRLGD